MSGCSSSPSSPSGNTASYPSAGSTFSYTYTSVDTNGVTSTPSDSTYSILSDSMTYGGKTNVLAVESQDGGISYYHLETNGDISIYVDLSSLIPVSLPFPLPITTNWFVIPIGSGTEQTSTLFDTTITVPISGTNTQVTILIQTNAKDLGAATVSAAGNSFACEQGSITVTASATTFGGFVQLAASAQTTTIWYSKQLKYYPERQDKTVNSGLLLGNSTTSDTYLLSSYNVK
jgi:hypothetical protein